LALGQTAAPSGADDHKGATDSPAVASAPDRNAPITQGQAAALLEEMRRLEILLSARAQSAAAAASSPATPGGASGPAGPVTLQLRATDHALGDAAAPIVMVEFADLQCPFCKDFQETTFPALESTYIKTGRVRFVVRDLPLKNHPYAKPAAEAVRCAGEQGKYWELRSALLVESGPPSAATIAADADKVHLQKEDFEECLSRHAFRSDIDAEESEADLLGINGTPSFLIGRPLDGKMQGSVIQGNRSIDIYSREIERILKEGTEHMGSAPGPGPSRSATKDKPG
jgi:protein-disulfide isomerase